jgi:hypothetical protein
MTLAYEGERRLRPKGSGPLDYDDSLVPGEIVAGILHLPNVSRREENELGLELRVCVWNLARLPAPEDLGTVGKRLLWRDADDCDPDLVPGTRPYTTALALAA